jgi:Oxysterol-binding protein
LQGYNAQKASFSRTIHVKQIGHALLTLTPPGSTELETYLITLPALHIESLIYGSPFVELNRFTHIASSTGYVAKIDYSGKGWLSGKKNSFTAALWKEGEGGEKHPIYTVDGQWNDNLTFRKGEGKHGKEIEHYDAKAAKITPLIVVPIEEQDPYESRKAWAKVSRSIEKGDMDATSYYKSRIEVAQRALRKKEQEEKREWKRVFFSQAKSSNPEEVTFQQLVKMISGVNGWQGVEPEKTAGVWRFDAEKAKSAKPPYHAEGLSGLGESEDTMTPISQTTTRTSTDSGRR